jgi:hypothetical protein
VNEEAIKGFESFFGATPVDRTGILDGIIDTNYTVAIPNTKGFDKNIETVITERANELDNTSKDIVLLWSGGIDSTVVFYALVEANIKFDIVYTRNSIKEYPKLGNEIESGKFSNNVKSLHKWNEASNEYWDNKIVVTGEIGDQIVGTQMLCEYVREHKDMPYKDILKVEHYEHFNKSIDSLLGCTEHTTAEFLWALNFVFKYESVLSRIGKYKIKNDTVEYFHFYNSDDFQRWALLNYKTNVIFDKDTEYKSVSKKYIFSKNNDELYLKHKTKVGSLLLVDK